MEIDHIIPLWKGGADHQDNMQLLCPDCHSIKTFREHPPHWYKDNIENADLKHGNQD